MEAQMKSFIYRLLGWECCGEWTQWTTRQARYSRDGEIAFRTDTIVYTLRWQERQCAVCGRMQQRDLKQ